ncbi:MAG: acyltransferase [Eubacterium sp.]|nr:acyltransferase [Eubacterium sp.]
MGDGNDNRINQTNRIIAIDVAKGLSICAIVLGHVSTGLLWDTTLIFATAAFFLLSGLTFNLDREEKGNFMWKMDTHFYDIFKKIFKRLIVPYLIWGVISIIIYMVYLRWIAKILTMDQIPKAIIDNLLGLVYGNSAWAHFEWNRPLWFLPCLFVVEIIAYSFLKISEKNNIFQTIMAVLLMCGGLCWMYHVDKVGSGVYVWPFETETALAMVFFFMLGFILRKPILGISTRYIPLPVKVAMLSIGAIMIMAIMVMVTQRGGADTRTDLYRGIGYYLLGAGLGITATFLFALVINGTYGGDKLSYIGKKTMGILVLHKFPIMFGKVFLDALPKLIGITVNQEGVIFELIFATIIVLVTLLAEWVITYFIPDAFGPRFI